MKGVAYFLKRLFSPGRTHGTGTLKGKLDKAYDGMTDASGVQMLKLFGSDMPKLAHCLLTPMHTQEHYGNLVVYMRLKNIVPPSSEPKSPSSPKK